MRQPAVKERKESQLRKKEGERQTRKREGETDETASGERKKERDRGEE